MGACTVHKTGFLELISSGSLTQLPQSRLTPRHFPRKRGQLLVSAAASLPDEGGGCECNEQTEGVLLLLYQIAPTESMNNLVTKQKTPRIWGVMLRADA